MAVLVLALLLWCTASVALAPLVAAVLKDRGSVGSAQVTFGKYDRPHGEQ